MVDRTYTVSLNFEGSNTEVLQEIQPLLELIVETLVINGGPTSTVRISPDLGNDLMNRPNGLYVSSIKGAVVETMIENAINEALSDPDNFYSVKKVVEVVTSTLLAGDGVTVTADEELGTLTISLADERLTTEILDKINNFPTQFKTVNDQSLLGEGNIVGYNDEQIQNRVTAISNRLSAVEGTAQLPPVVIPAPIKMLKTGEFYDLDFSDNFVTNSDEILTFTGYGLLPDGMSNDGARVLGEPLREGNFSFIIRGTKLDGAFAELLLSLSVSNKAVTSPMTMTPAPGGLIVQNLGTFRNHVIAPTVGGLSLELM